jgi:selenocysteine lyase/cysteine desulfurase
MGSVIDLVAERRRTPGCLGQAFLDSAGSSLPTRETVEAVVAHLRREAEVGGYRAAHERAEELAALPAAIAGLIGAESDEIALTDSATRAWTQFVGALRLGVGDRVLICGNEYASNAIALLQRARFDGCSVEVVPSDPEGRVDLGALAGMLDERVRLVSLVHVPTGSGQIAPVAEASALARAAGARVLLDACQSVGQLAVDVRELGVDALSVTGRKWLRAPRGTGFLYVRRELIADLEPRGADLRAGVWTAPADYELRPDAGRFEQWEADIAGRLGLKVAVDHLLELGPATVEEAVRANASRLRNALAELPRVTVRDLGPDLSGIVTFTVEGIEPAKIQERLRDSGVTVSTSGASSTLLDLTARDLESVVRASPHYFVSDDDLDRATAAVADL